MEQRIEQEFQRNAQKYFDNLAKKAERDLPQSSPNEKDDRQEVNNKIMERYGNLSLSVAQESENEQDSFQKISGQAVDIGNPSYDEIVMVKCNKSSLLNSGNIPADRPQQKFVQ